MAEPLKHKISDEAIRVAQEHEREAEATGRLIEHIGKTISASNDSEAATHSQAIGQQAKIIQDAVEKSRALTEELEQNHSTETYTKVLDTHIKATRAHVEAVKEFLSTSKIL